MHTMLSSSARPCLRSLPAGSREAWAPAPRAWTRPRPEAEPDASLKDVWAPRLLPLNVCADYRAISGTDDTLGSRRAIGISTSRTGQEPQGPSLTQEDGWAPLLPLRAGLGTVSGPSHTNLGASPSLLCGRGSGEVLTAFLGAFRDVLPRRSRPDTCNQGPEVSQHLPRTEGPGSPSEGNVKRRSRQQQHSLSRAEVRSRPSLRAARRATQSPTRVRYDCQMGDNVLLHLPVRRRLHLPHDSDPSSVL